MEYMDENKIYTLVGYYGDDNIFRALSGEEISCITYREYNRYIVGKLSCVNMRYSFQLNCWIIFQAVLL